MEQPKQSPRKNFLPLLFSVFTRFPAAWLTALASAVVLLHIKEDFQAGVISNDIHTYWQYARNLLAGNGFVGNTLTSTQLWNIGFNFRPIGTVLHPLIIAACTLFVKDWLLACIFPTCLLYVATVPLLFAFARSLFGKTTAVIACVLFIFNRPAVLFTLFGGSDPLFTFLLIAIVFVLFKTKGWPGILTAGILMGLLKIARPVGPMYLPPLLFYAWIRNKDTSTLKKAAYIVVLALLSVSFAKAIPAINKTVFNNASIYGKKLGPGKAGALLVHSPVYPRYTAKRVLSMPDAPWRMILTDPFVLKGFTAKVLANIQGIFRGLAHDLAGNWILSVLALLALLRSEQDYRKRAIKYWYVLCLVFQLGILTMSLYTARYIYPMSPFLLVLAASGLKSVIDKFAKSSTKKCVLYTVSSFALILPLPVGHSLIPSQQKITPCKIGKKCIPVKMLFSPVKQGKPIYQYEQFGRFLQSNLSDTQTLMSDGGLWIPDLYGGGTRSLATYPRTIQLMDELHSNKLDNFDALLMTDIYIRQDIWEWYYLFDAPQEFLGFTPHEFETWYEYTTPLPQRTYRKKFRAVLFTRNSEQQTQLLLEQTQNPQNTLLENIRLAATALKIKPKLELAREKLENFRSQAFDTAEKLILQAEGQIEKGLNLKGFNTFISAGAYMDNLTPNDIKDTVSSLIKAGQIKYNCYNFSSVKPELTLSHFPASQDQISGTFCNPGFSKKFGEIRADYIIDLKQPRYIDKVTLTAYDDARDYIIERATVYTSIDGINWTQQAQSPELHFTKPNFYEISIKIPPVIAPLVKVEVKGHNFVRFYIGQIQVWGYSDENIDHHPVYFKQLIPAHRTFRHTGKKLPVPAAKRKKPQLREEIVAQPGRDKAGLMVYGAYLRLTPGQYEALFDIKVTDIQDPTKPLFTLDIYADRGQKPLVEKVFYAKDVKNDDFNMYTLAFEPLKKDRTVKGQEDFNEVECRMAFHNNAKLVFGQLIVQGTPDVISFPKKESGKQ